MRPSRGNLFERLLEPVESGVQCGNARPSSMRRFSLDTPPPTGARRRKTSVTPQPADSKLASSLFGSVSGREKGGARGDAYSDDWEDLQPPPMAPVPLARDISTDAKKLAAKARPLIANYAPNT